MTLVPVDTLPARGAKAGTRSKESLGDYTQYEEGHRVRNVGYDALLRAFADADNPLSLVVAPHIWHPETVYRGLRSARRAGGYAGRIDVARRGDSSYLVRVTTGGQSRAALRSHLRDILKTFDASEQHERTLDGLDDSAWRTLRYLRTREGFGHVRVERVRSNPEGGERIGEDSVRLVNTLIEKGE